MGRRRAYSLRPMPMFLLLSVKKNNSHSLHSLVFPFSLSPACSQNTGPERGVTSLDPMPMPLQLPSEETGVTCEMLRTVTSGLIFKAKAIQPNASLRFFYFLAQQRKSFLNFFCLNRYLKKKKKKDIIDKWTFSVRRPCQVL